MSQSSPSNCTVYCGGVSTGLTGTYQYYSVFEVWRKDLDLIFLKESIKTNICCVVSHTTVTPFPQLFSCCSSLQMFSFTLWYRSVWLPLFDFKEEGIKKFPKFECQSKCSYTNLVWIAFLLHFEVDPNISSQCNATAAQQEVLLFISRRKNVHHPICLWFLL